MEVKCLAKKKRLNAAEFTHFLAEAGGGSKRNGGGGMEAGLKNIAEAAAAAAIEAALDEYTSSRKGAQIIPIKKAV